MITKTETGVLVMKGENLAWGIVYEGGGHGDPTAYGWMPPADCDLSDPRHCKEPWHLTYKGSPSAAELQRHGRIVHVRRTITIEEIEPPTKN